MKLYLLAAAAMIAAPAIAQDTAPQGGMTDPAAQQAPADGATMPAPTDPATPMGSPAAPMGAQADPAMTAPPAPAASTMADPNAPTPAGGYQPSQPALSGAAAPGATVRFQQAPSPDQAYPAPAPLAKYPVCKKGQYDKCRNPGGK